jgi:Domain of unknown function (DUF5047)
MRTVSAALLRTVTGSHQMAARARVCTSFQIGTDPAGTVVDLIDGDVVIDALAQVRGTADVVISGQSWPRRAGDLLAPYGNELYLERGVVFGNGVTEWVGLGYFRIQTPEQTRPPKGPIRIAAMDRMAGLVDGRLISPKQYTAATTFNTVITDLVDDVYPSATIDWDDASGSLPIGRAITATDDRFGTIDDLVTSLGKIWYWDYRGRLQIRAQPTSAIINASVSAGAGGVLVTSSRTVTRTGVYNAAVVTGQGADNASPLRAVAFDDNPDSPTYYRGRFGPVPQFFTAPTIIDNPTAQVAANALLMRSIGLPYEVDFQAVPNPALEPWDVLEVRHAVTEGVERHQIRQITMPLVAGRAMTAQTKEMTVVRIGHA